MAPFDRKSLRLTLCLCLGWTLLYGNRTVLYPLLTVIGDQFSLSGTQLGIITGSYFLTYVITQIPFGIIGDRYGKKTLLTATYFTVGLSLFCFALFGNSYILLIVFTALHGFGAGAYYPSAYGIMLESIHYENRAMAAAIVNLGMSLGLAMGLTIAGPIFLHTNSYSGIFFALAVLTMAAALFFQKCLPDSRRKSNPEAEKIRPTPVLRILKNKNLICLNLSRFCANYGSWVVITWGPAFFQQERGISIAFAGLFVAITGISSILPSLIAGRISDKIGRKKICLLLFPLGALTVFLIAWAKSPLSIIFMLITNGIFGRASMDPVSIAWAGDHAISISKNAMGTASGILNFSGMMASVIAPVISGFIQDISGSLTAAFYVGAIVNLLGLFFVMLVDEYPAAENAVPET